MRINPFIFGILILVVFLGTILGFQAAGIWSVSGKMSSSGQAVQPSASDVETIKGWMTLQLVTDTYQVPLSELLQQFGLPADTPASAAIKDLETDTFSVTNLRTWLQSRTAAEQPASSAPAEQPEAAVPQSTGIPPAAVTPTTASAAAQSTPAALPTPTVHVVADKTVTGKTTFQQLLDWGVSSEAIQAVIGASLPDPSTLVKDFASAQGLDFPTIKAQLQAEVDKVK